MDNKQISGTDVTLEFLEDFLAGRPAIQLTDTARKRMQAARRIVQQKIDHGETIYGINTGFGKLAQVKIPAEDLQHLQLNLLRSHACCVGEPIEPEIVALMMLLKINNLAAGYSGCSVAVVEKMVELLNRGILAIVPRRGSVGASGDLAPLAHMCLPLIGEGEVLFEGERRASAKLVEDGIFEPVALGPKDGLSLINGTQYCTALLARSLLEARHLLLLAELAAAMSIEAELATDVPFQPEIQEVRNQEGQKTAARHIFRFLQDSEIVKSHLHCSKVQDPYSFRCTPQVLGVVRDSLDFAIKLLERELNAVTDNPLVFAESGKVLSAGNFHAEPLGFAADQLSIALTELANISERRIANLTDSAMSNLPAFLVRSSGVNSGFMIAHVTVAALCAENRGLAHPASVENVPTSANQEDHVSMAPNANLKLWQILENVKTIVWIELLVAAQGIDFRKPLKGGNGTQLAYERIRELVPFLDHDRLLYRDFEKGDSFFNDRALRARLSEIAESE